MKTENEHVATDRYDYEDYKSSQTNNVNPVIGNLLDDLFSSAEKAIPATTEVAKDEAELDQKSFEWHLHRIDKFTGSIIKGLMTKGSAKGEEWGETVKGIIKHMKTLLTMTDEGRAEYIYQQMRKDFVQTRWGNDNEPIAREEYCQIMGVNVEVPGFTVNPKCPYHGGSFDGEIYEQTGELTKGIIEIKCPYDPDIHEDNYDLMLRVNSMRKNSGNETWFDTSHKDYHQFQSNIETAGADYCDFISFDPRQGEKYRLVVIRVYRDQIFIDAMMNRVHQAKRILDLYLSGVNIDDAILQSN